jgi:hypothetical protein
MDWEAKAEAARRRYNDLWADRPIKQIGDTPDVYFFLFTFSGWENGTPLSEQEIRAVEMIFAVRSRSAVMYQRPCRTMADRSKRKGRTSKGRPIHRASSSVVAEEIYNAI